MTGEMFSSVDRFFIVATFLIAVIILRICSALWKVG